MHTWIYRESNAVFTAIILYLAILSYSAFFFSRMTSGIVLKFFYWSLYSIRVKEYVLRIE
jgi:hypothetical protein